MARHVPWSEDKHGPSKITMTTSIQTFAEWWRKKKHIWNERRNTFFWVTITLLYLYAHPSSSLFGYLARRCGYIPPYLGLWCLRQPLAQMSMVEGKTTGVESVDSRCKQFQRGYERNSDHTDHRHQRGCCSCTNCHLQAGHSPRASEQDDRTGWLRHHSRVSVAGLVHDRQVGYHSNRWLKNLHTLLNMQKIFM